MYLPPDPTVDHKSGYGLDDLESEELNRLSKNILAKIISEISQIHLNLSEEMKEFVKPLPNFDKKIITTHMNLMIEQDCSSKAVRIIVEYKYKIGSRFKRNAFYLDTLGLDSSYFKINNVVVNQTRAPFWNTSERPPNEPNCLEIALPRDCLVEGTVSINYDAQASTHTFSWERPEHDGKKFKILGPGFLPGQYTPGVALTYKIGMSILEGRTLILESEVAVPLHVPLYLVRAILRNIQRT